MTTAYRNLFRLDGRTALVTGSSRGIGAAIAKGLAAFGAKVVVHGQAPESTQSTCEAILEAGGACVAVHGDLAAPGAGRDLIRQAEEAEGLLDILVINASAQINGTLDTVTDEDFATQVNVNLRSTVEMLQACLPGMAERGWGRVVNIGSINQLRPKGIVAIYAATKAAQHNLIQSLARDYAPKGVLLNTLAPGLIDTDRNAPRRDADPEGWAAYVRQLNWMGRAGHVDEMVGAAVLLASDACSFMTGEAIVLSGGY
ncbi:SDR family oxidoreductase [Chelativorans sp. AA-79]|uniref:SDR family NAD(P)-dependent oxidoreductase n=1 Tax=Chelativorans sp. AA-79 TaxID=3028735 RepID=UPI0023F9FE26|nr:SDR family oxidoreductase [Chelativorans sp. AA-79]WEX11068.1 SDR family NAD(P)-dependent oxidoreductase [Chelativorans sp. AA-79]